MLRLRLVLSSEWGGPDYVVEQLRHYREFLKPKHMALAVLTRPTTQCQ